MPPKMSVTADLIGQPQLWNTEQVISFPERGEIKPFSAPSRNSDSMAENVWLFHAQSGLCGLLVADDSVQVNKRDVLRIVIFQHDDQVQIADSRWTYRDIYYGLVSPEIERPLAVCGYCTGGFDAGDLFIRCPLCFALYHEDCWITLEDKRCCTRGCSFLPNKVNLVV